MNRVAISIGASAMLVVAALLLPRGPWLREGPPAFTSGDQVAMALAAAAAVALAWAAPRQPQPIGTGDRLMVLAAVVLAWSLALCMAFSPATFTLLLVEDGVVEWASAVLLLGCAVALGVSLFGWRGVRSHLALRAVFCIVLLLVGLEEVSWFQRQLALETPDWLALSNAQGELNFHNTATSLFENLYYAGAALLLVASRVLVSDGTRSAVGRWLQPLLPGPAVFAIGALATSFNWDMWRIVFIMAAFAIGVSLSSASALAAWQHRDRRAFALFAAVAATVVLTQALFLLFGENMLRTWDATEAKEFFIALGLALYALEQARTVRGAGTTRAGMSLKP